MSDVRGRDVNPSYLISLSAAEPAGLLFFNPRFFRLSFASWLLLAITRILLSGAWSAPAAANVVRHVGWL